MITGGPSEPRIVGRYALHGEIAAGGMATVHLARMLGAEGFSKPVAIKRLHAQLAKDPEFVTMFLDEARLAARLQHPNIVSTLDVVADAGELFLVMEYIEGEPLSGLLRSSFEAGAACPPRIAAAIVGNVLHGLQHAHAARNARGEPLDLVHRDVSPQNVLVGVDGLARLLDFGIAKAIGRAAQTREGQLKGKLAYMPPEALEGLPLDGRADVYATGIVLWEALAGRRLFPGEADQSLFARILTERVPLVSEKNPSLERYDDVVARAIHRDRDQRYASAHQMILALEQCGPSATPTEVAQWVRSLASASLDRRSALLRELEASELSPVPALPAPPPPPPAPVPAARGGARRGLVVAASLLAAATLLAVTVARRQAAREPVPAAPITSAETPDPGETAAEAIPADVPPLPSAEAAPSSARASRGLRTSAPARAATACDPPYVLDSAGRRHYKMECVRAR